MKLSDFDYHIPEEQIAQSPLSKRDSSRLLVIHRKTSAIEHRSFRDISSYLTGGDVLVINNTKVIPARLYGLKPTGGKSEITLLKEIELNVWTALVKNVCEGTITLQKGISARVSRINGTVAKVKFSMPDASSDIGEHLREIGVMPLPVYIKRKAVRTDLDQYQTVYAEDEGAIAAPTAGLHFTQDLLDDLRARGIEIHVITLHVGYGTFKPVEVSDIKNHQMEEERFEIPESTAAAINAAKSEDRRVIAVGTTVTRALESAVSDASPVGERIIEAGPGTASIFIYPGYRFRVIDSLITNFHLPKSTPIMLASAFTGLEALKNSYKLAQEEGYRFYSYGDAMLII